MTCAAGTDGHRGGRTRPGCHCGHGRRRHRDGHRRHRGQDGGQHRRRHHHRAGTRPRRGRHGRRRDGPCQPRRRPGHHGPDRRRGHLGHARAAAACCSGWAAAHRAGPCQPGWDGPDRASLVAAAHQTGGRPDRAPRGHRGRLGQPGPGAARSAAPSPCRTRPGQTGCCPGGVPGGGHHGHQAGAGPAVARPDPGLPDPSRPGRSRAAVRPAVGRVPGRAAAGPTGWPARRRWAPPEPGPAGPGQPGAAPQDGVPGRPRGRRRGGRRAGRGRGRRLSAGASRRAGGRRGLRPGWPGTRRGTATIAVGRLAGLGRPRLALRPPARGLLALAAELVFKSANYGRLDRGGRRTDKLAHFLELGHHGLALYPELFREFVYPDLRHCAPSVGPAPPGHRGRSGAARAPDGLSFGFSSPRSHRALITTDPAFPALLPFFPTCLPGPLARPAQPGSPRACRYPTGSACAAPARVPCGAARARSIPGWDADTRPGRAAALAGQERYRPRPPPNAASQT